ncbi:MAG: GntR family transcriptional regulator [Chitinivibrionales bacterium]|nr:GntR family transcriptional regulator [Chitinivibrionales bacterium]
MARPSYVVRQLVHQLRVLVSELRTRHSDTLPTTLELARRFGVSKGSVSRAVAVLCAEGLLRARRGSGIRIASGEVPPVQGPPPERTRPVLLSRWEQVRSQIVRDFLAKALRDDVCLPSARSLAGRYGASRRTVRTALQTLVDSGRLEPRGVRYVVRAAGQGRARKSIVLVQLATSEGLPARRYPNEEQNLMWLERVCGERGIGVRPYLLSPGRTELLPFSSHVPRSIGELDESVLGVIAWLPGDAGRSIDVVLRSIRLPHRPVAVSARRVFLERKLYRPEHGPLRGFGTSEYGFDAGLDVGRYLRAHGHCRIVFVCPESGPRTAVPQRVVGMRASLEQSEPRGELLLLSYRRIQDESVPSANAAVGRNEFDELASRFGAGWRLDGREQLIMRAVRASGLLLRGRIRRLLLEDELRRAFDRYRLPSGATALVAFNDDVALVCLKLLRERRIRVPEDISLISFDDTAEASLVGITSYNFNESQVLLSMLDWVLWPRQQKGAGIAAPPQGFLSDRGTVTAVASRASHSSRGVAGPGAMSNEQKHGRNSSRTLPK